MLDTIDMSLIAWSAGVVFGAPLIFVGGFMAGRAKRESDFQRMARSSRWKFAPRAAEDLGVTLEGHMELYDLKAGHILSNEDVSNLGLMLNEFETLMENDVDSFMQGRKDAAFEIGGQELLDALMAQQERRCREAVDRAMEKFTERTGK